MPRFPSRAIAYALIAFSVAVCDDPTGPSPVPEAAVLPQLDVVEGPLPYPILAGAGDVANCTLGNDNDESTARLLDVIFANGQPGNVMQLGEPDETATAANYPGCYVDTWGRHKAITRPMAGNKDYINGNLDHYFRYWGAAAGEAPGGYYSFDVNENWHVVVINSNNTFVPTNSDAAPQVAWLRNDLLVNTKPCIAAFMHHPRFFSSTTPNVDTEAGSLRPVWNELYKHGAEFVASGNRHHYERLKPMRPDGTVDVPLGVIQFISGTGGTSLGLPQEGVGSIHPNSEVRGVDYGVVKFTLKPDGYDWQFVPARNRFNDAGSANCHPPTIPVSLRMTSSSPSSVYSQPVTFTAKAEDGTNTVRVGTMSFISGGTCDAPVGVLASDLPLDETGRARFTTLSLDVAGSPHSIIACYTGAGSYQSSSGEITHTVERATASVTLADLVATYDGLAKSATATTAPPDLPVSLAYATAAGGAVAAPIDAGEYTVTATVEDPNYSGSASDLFRIEKATPIIAWAQPAPITYGTALGPTQLNATASFNNQIVAGSFTYSPAAGTVLDAGPNQVLSADFTPTAAGNFNDVLGTTVLISVGGATQTIDFASPGDKTFGDPPFELSATATSGLVVSFAALGACSVLGATVTIDEAGGCTLTASQGGNANYQPAENVVHSIVIARRIATVTLGSLFHNYDGQPKSASASTDAPGESTFQFEYQRNGTAVAQPTDAGTYGVVATLINANYQGAATGTLIINAGPVATADAYSVDEDGALSVVPPGVIGNDVDSDGGEIAPSLVSSTSDGTLEFNADGSFAYAPRRDFNGSDAFSYRISDGSVSSDPVTVTITVNPVNDAPVATADSYTTAENEVLEIAASGVLANDTDVDGDAISAELAAAPAHGRLVLASSGSFTYTPNDGFNGGDSFTYRASDGSASSEIVTVTITVTSVNSAPAVVDDPSYVVDEDHTLTTPATASVLANDSDGDRDPLTAELVEGPLPGATASFALNPDGTFSFQPAPEFFGTITFTYRATDGTAVSGSATVTITVNGINDAPSFAAGADQTVDEDAGTQTVVGWASMISAGPTNESGQTVAFDITTNTNPALFATQPAVSPAGVLTYTPAANANGEATLTIVLRDNGGTAGGGSDASASRTFRVTVNAVNDVPVANAQSVSTTEDTPVSITLTASDIEGDAVTFEITAAPLNGSLAPTGTPGTYTYTPNANFSGTDEFAFTASDGTPCTPATVTITVGMVNDAPVASNDQYGIDEDNVLAVGETQGVLSNDADIDGDPLTASLVADRGPSNGTVVFSADGSFTYTPNRDFNGTDSFEYQASDGRLSSSVATVTIAVAAANDAPVAGDDAFDVVEDTPRTFSVLANDSDPEASPLTPELVAGQGPTNGTVRLNADGTFTYTPNADFSGSDGFSYTVSDGSATSNVARVTITVNPVNDAPVAADNTYETREDTPLNIPAAGVLANDADIDADALSATLLSGPTNGTLLLNADGSFAYTPSPDFSGLDSFTYQAGDGGLQSNAATVTIAVSAVNDRPLAQPQSVTTDEDTPLTVTLGGQDVEGNPLSYRITAQPSQGTLSGDGTTYVYTAGANYFGNDAFSFVVNDGTEDSAPAVVSLTVRAVNDIPTAIADRYVTDEDNLLVVAAAQGILANDGDVDGDAITAAVVRPPAYGTLMLNADGSLTYAPLANFTGDDSFTYTATDPSGGASPMTTVSITVTAVNDAPAVDAIAELTGAERATVAFTATATDPEADAITFSLVGAPAGATIDAATGAFTWTPTEAQGPGTYVFAVRATDDGAPALGGERQVTITITEVNATPVLGSIGDKSVVWGNALTFTATAADVDEPANILTFSLPNAPAGATINGSTGEFSWTPNATQGAGTYEITVRVSDGLSNADGQITVTVINPAPGASGMSRTSAVAQANAPDFELEVSGSGFAPTSAVQWNGATLATTFISATSLTAVVPGSEIAAPGTHYVRVLNGAPGGGASDKLAFFVTDALAPVTASSVGTSESSTGTARAMTTAESSSDATVEAIATGAGTVAVATYASNPGGTPSFAAVGLWFDVNVEEGSTFSEVQIKFCNIADGTLVQWWNAASGGWEAVEPAAQLSGGCLSLTVSATSKPSLTDLTGDYFAIGKNTAPQALNDAATVAEDGSQTIQVLSNDVDAEGDVLSTVLVDGPAHGTVVHNADGSFTYSPAANFNGTDAFTYRATDGSLPSSVATVTVTVTAVNDAPTAAADSYTADEDKPLVIAAPGVLTNDADVDGQPLSAVLVSEPANGTVTLNGDGSFTYTPRLHFSGNDVFSYRASDGSESSEPVSVAIVVRPRMTVLLDMVPGSSTNSIGYSSSQTQVVFAVLSTPSFDATLVDPATTTLGNDEGTDTPLAKNSDGSFKFMLVDVNGDARRDFYAYVDKALMKTNGDLTLTTTSLTVLGRLKSPRTELFRGKDKVTVVP